MSTPDLVGRRVETFDSAWVESIGIKRTSIWMVFVLALAKVERAQAILEVQKGGIRGLNAYGDYEVCTPNSIQVNLCVNIYQNFIFVTQNKFNGNVLFSR
jgi:hypothetical protein